MFNYDTISSGEISLNYSVDVRDPLLKILMHSLTPWIIKPLIKSNMINRLFKNYKNHRYEKEDKVYMRLFALNV